MIKLNSFIIFLHFIKYQVIHQIKLILKINTFIKKSTHSLKVHFGVYFVLFRQQQKIQTHYPITSIQLLLTMLNKKPQTIQGFLSPTKLLSAGFRNAKQTSKGPKSPLASSSTKKQQVSDSRYNSQNQSYLNTSREIENPIIVGKDNNFSRLTGENNYNFTGQSIEERRYQSQRKIPFTFDRETRNGFNDTSKNVPRQIEQEGDVFQSKSRTISQSNNPKWQTQKYRNQSGQPPRVRNDLSGNLKQSLSSSKPSLSQGLFSNVKGNNSSDVMTIQCFQLIRKLSKIKENLQLQISQLQNLLDNTSRYMDNMEQEFEKIKDSILSYTSNCLDTAFTQYKKNMVEWQKYEDFERKSLVMLSEINDYIYNQEQNLSTNKNLSNREFTAISQQLERQILYYRQFTDQIKKIREQCIGMRPTLTEERIKEFQKGLAVLCNF